MMPAITSAFKDTFSFQNSNFNNHLQQLSDSSNTHDQDSMKAAIKGGGLRNQRDHYNSVVKRAESKSKDENQVKRAQDGSP